MPKLTNNGQPNSQVQTSNDVSNKRGRKAKNNRGRPSLKDQKNEQNRSGSRSRSRSRSRDNSSKNREKEELQGPDIPQVEENKEIKQFHPERGGEQNNGESDNEQQNNEIEGEQGNERIQMPSNGAENRQYQNAIRSILITFFDESKYPNGFVFKVQERVKLIKEREKLKRRNVDYKQINWRQTLHYWSEAEEQKKVNEVFEDNCLELSQEVLGSMKEIFKNSSFMFADEATGELYELLFQILKVAVQTKGSLQNERICDLMREIASGGQRWRFFGFNFSGLYPKKLIGQQAQMVYRKLGESLLSVIKQKLS